MGEGYGPNGQPYTAQQLFDRACFKALSYKATEADIALLRYRCTDYISPNLKGFFCSSLLYQAVQQNDEKVVAILLLHKDIKVDVGSFDTQDTPLMLAIQLKLYRIAWVLLKYGADLNAENKSGETPIHLAKKDPKMLSIIADYQKKAEEMSKPALAFHASTSEPRALFSDEGCTIL